MFLTYIIIILAVALQNSNSALNVNTLTSSYQLIEELLDALNRKDYVDVWIKLIDLNLKLNSPDLFSKEMIHLLTLRRRLVKLHKYYLKIYPSRVPVNNFTNNYDNNWLTKQDLTPILNVLNLVAQETNSLVDSQTKIEGIPTSDDQIFSIFNSVANTLIHTTEDVFSGGIPSGEYAGYMSDDFDVGKEKPLLGVSPTNNVQFSEETNNAIYDSMKQLSDLIESAPHPNQSNFTPTAEINHENIKTTLISIITTTASPNISNNDGSAVVNDAFGSLFTIFNVLANPDQTSTMNNTKK